MLGKQVCILVLVAGGDDLLQPKRLEVQGEIPEEIRHPGVVAVTQDGLVLEVLLIVSQLVLDVFEPGIELVVLSLLGRMEVAVGVSHIV